MAEQTVPLQRASPETYRKTERRAWIRFPSEQDINCRPLTPLGTEQADTAWLGEVRDISPVGIGLRMSRRFEPGAVLIVELSAEPEGVLLRLPVRVVHATLEGKGHWIIGCAFACELSPEEMQIFLREERADQ